MRPGCGRAVLTIGLDKDQEKAVALYLQVKGFY